MRPRMRREDRRVVAVLGFLHGVVHANILSIPIFLLAWKLEFGADDVTLGLLAAAGFGFYGLGAVPFGFLADRRPAGGLLLLCAAGIPTSIVGVGASPSIPGLAPALGAPGPISGVGPRPGGRSDGRWREPARHAANPSVFYWRFWSQRPRSWSFWRPSRREARSRPRRCFSGSPCSRSSPFRTSSLREKCLSPFAASPSVSRS